MWATFLCYEKFNQNPRKLTQHMKKLYKELASHAWENSQESIFNAM